MYLSRGLYVFPNKNTIRRFMYDGDEATELPEITFEQQLIDFLEIDLTPFNRLLDKLKARSTANIPKIAVRIKIPKTALLRFHFSISVEMIVIVFSSFLPPII